MPLKKPITTTSASTIEEKEIEDMHMTSSIILWQQSLVQPAPQLDNERPWHRKSSGKERTPIKVPFCLPLSIKRLNGGKNTMRTKLSNSVEDRMEL